MNFINKKGFTLVELIVVITILALLGTIAFISLQGYSRDTRDSTRLSDMGSIKKGLELFQLNNGRYPETSSGNDITFSGSVAWIQGSFGEETFRSIGKLSTIPKDPLTGLEYIYSITNDRKEYQIAGIVESSDLVYNNILTTETNAVEETAILKISGTYNEKILKVRTPGVDYILAVPSLITSTGGKLEDIILHKRLAYNGYKNLPFNYGGGYKTIGETEDLVLVNTGSYIVFSGNPDDFVNNPAKQIELIENVQEAYTSTAISSEDTIKDIVELNGGPEFVAQTLINDVINDQVKVVAIPTNTVTTIPTTDTTTDTGPTIDPIMQLTYSGLINGDKVTLPFKGTVNITNIDWGDSGANGCPTTATAAVSCIYADANLGTYTIRVEGSSTGFGVSSIFPADNMGKLVSLDNWGDMGITDLSFAFLWATSLVSVSNELPSGVTDMSQMFMGANSFSQSLSFDTSSVTDMTNMFSTATSFNKPLDFDTSSVTDMGQMFQNASSFNQPLDFNILSVTDMNNMFNSATSFNQDLSGWDTTSVISCSGFADNTPSWLLSKPIPINCAP